MANPKVEVTNLWTKIQNDINSENFDAAIRHARELSLKTPDDVEVVVAKLYCLVNLNQFEGALELMDSNAKWANHFVFQRAYCLYRLFRLDEALSIVDANSAQPTPDYDLSELKAQILYRAEQYDVAAGLYSTICTAEIDDDEAHTQSERMTNYYAATAGAAVLGKVVPHSAVDELPVAGSYEAHYNLACKAMACGDFARAKEYLRQAVDLCRTSLLDEGFEEGDIDEEIATITLQQGVLEHTQGNYGGAKHVYESVLKSKPADEVVTAVAANNLASLIGITNSHEAKKRIKAATAAGLSQKFTSVQKIAIAKNHALLAYHSNQIAHCEASLNQLEGSHAETAGFVAVVRAALQLKKKDREGAHATLHTANDDIHARLAEAQLIMEETEGPGQSSESSVTALLDVIAKLEVDGVMHRYPAITGAAVAIYSCLNGLERSKQTDGDSSVPQVTYDSEIEIVFDNATRFHQNQRNTGRLCTVLRGQAQFYLGHNQPDKASVAYEKLLELNPEDKRAMAGLVQSYALFDCAKAEMYAQRLHNVDTSACTHSADELVLQFASLKKMAASKASESSAPKLKKKRKRKGKLPKNTNVVIDPERWLPKYERSYNKRKYKNKAQPVRGNQGAVVSSISGQTGSADKTKLDYNDGTTSTPAEGAASPKPTPKAGGGNANKNKKKKKRKK